MAPALGFGERWKEKLPEVGEEFDLFHHGEGRPLPIHRRFFEEMARVRVDEAPPHVAVSIVMGTDDEIGALRAGRGRVGALGGVGPPRPGSRFHRVDGGDHGLVARGDEIESAVRERMAG